MENENQKLKGLAQEFFKNNNNPNESDLYNFLTQKQWEIYINYDKDKHKQQIVYELQELEYKVEEIPQDTIDAMVEDFEEMIYGDESKYLYCIKETIDNYKEDLEEYKGEE